MKVTQSQLTAIQHGNSNLQLIACAGSGKTEVVARRVASLLKSGFKPGNIIALTFTDKAAAELKERIITRCAEELGQVPGMAEMYVGTIHALCLDLLKSEVPEYLKFDVLNEVQQSVFIDRHSRESGLTTSTDLQGRKLSRYKDTPHSLTAISILREADTDDDLSKGCSVVEGLEDYRELLTRAPHRVIRTTGCCCVGAPSPASTQEPVRLRASLADAKHRIVCYSLYLRVLIKQMKGLLLRCLIKAAGVRRITVLRIESLSFPPTQKAKGPTASVPTSTTITECERYCLFFFA